MPVKRKQKKYEDLVITDDFMFGKVMRHPRRCGKLLEMILGVKIREVVFLEDQEFLNPDYAALKKSYVIFICTFDLFGAGRQIYHFENLCREDPAIRLDDGTEKIFLNTKGRREAASEPEEVGEDLWNLLGYLEGAAPCDAYTEELDKAVRAAREHREWRREYMKLEVMRWDMRREGREEGRTEGELTKLINQIYRKAVKGKLPEEMAQDLEEDVVEVKRIYDVVVKYISDFDTEKILEELNGC